MLRICLTELFIISCSTKKRARIQFDSHFSHSAWFTIAWIEYVMSLKPVVMMAWMMRMCVSYSMRMTLMNKEMCMLVCCLPIRIACHGPKDIGVVHANFISICYTA